MGRHNTECKRAVSARWASWRNLSQNPGPDGPGKHCVATLWLKSATSKLAIRVSMLPQKLKTALNQQAAYASRLTNSNQITGILKCNTETLPLAKTTGCLPLQATRQSVRQVGSSRSHSIRSLASRQPSYHFAPKSKRVRPLRPVKHKHWTTPILANA